MKIKIIVIDTNKVHDIDALFLLLERELGVDFGRNLDGLADILHDVDVNIKVSDENEFLRVFGREMTREYFGDRYTEDTIILGKMLLQIFK